jgi:hypothetical protein
MLTRAAAIRPPDPSGHVAAGTFPVRHSA